MKKSLKNFSVYIYLGISILTAVLAQLFMKVGMESFAGFVYKSWGSSVARFGGHKDFYLIMLVKILKIILIIFSNKFIILGIVLYLLSMVFWISVLSKMDLSEAYPFVSLGIVVTVFLAALALKEPIPLMRWAGIFITLGGVYLIVSSHVDKPEDKKED